MWEVAKRKMSKERRPGDLHCTFMKRHSASIRRKTPAGRWRYEILVQSRVSRRRAEIADDLEQVREEIKLLKARMRETASATDPMMLRACAWGEKSDLGRVCWSAETSAASGIRTAV